MPTQEELYEEVLAQYYRDNEQGNDQNARPSNNIPLGSDASLSPTLGFRNGMVVPGVAVQGGNRYGYANAEFNTMGPPQAVNAGIEGAGGSLRANIPISDPKALSISGETDIAGNIITADWTPMLQALMLKYQQEF